MARSADPQFELGRLFATEGVLAAIKDSGQNLDDFLNRHIRGDWGTLSELDELKNDEALLTGDRIFSTYRTDNGTKFWIITEPVDENDGERKLTTVVLPSEY